MASRKKQISQRPPINPKPAAKPRKTSQPSKVEREMSWGISESDETDNQSVGFDIVAESGKRLQQEREFYQQSILNVFPIKCYHYINIF